MSVIVSILLIYIAGLLMPKPKGPEPGEAGNIPIAEEGAPIGVIFGKPVVSGQNTTWYGDTRADSFKTDGQKAGYRYYIGFRVVLGHGPIDSMRRITYGDREVWSGNLTASGPIDVDKRDLFGGTDREGGVMGRFSVAFGESTQGVNAYLQTQIGGVVPAFLYKCSVIAEQIYYGTNPYLKNFTWQPQRALSRDVSWYDAKADIDGHMNPAHMIVDAMTSPRFGAGLSVAAIDDASFRAAADTLYAEGFGLSAFWSFGRDPGAVPAFVQSVLDHIGGTVFPDPQTGLIRLELHRGGYDVGTLPLFDDSNSKLTEHDEGNISSTVNEVVLTYTQPDSDQPRTISAQNIGNVNTQGRVVSNAVSYTMIQSDDLAARMLDRDLRALSTPLDVGTLMVSRAGWNLYPGSVIRVTSARFNITESVFRVAQIEEPSLEESPWLSVRIVQDVFGLSAGSYVTRQPSLWVDPVQPVADIDTVILTEMPYYHMDLNLRPADLAALPPGYGFVQAFAPRQEQSWYIFAMHYSADNTTYGAEPAALGTFGPMLQLGAAITRLQTSLTIASAIDKQLVAVGQYGMLIEGALEEMVEITAWDPATLATSIKRSVMDSVPRAFTAAAQLVITSFPGGYDGTARADGAAAWYRLLPSNRDGTLAIGSATGHSIIPDSRASRPYPPGNVKVNGSYYPASIGTAAALTVSWAHRDRLQQTVGLTDWTTGDIGPEAGTTYTLRLYGELDTLLRTETGLTGISYSWIDESVDSGLYVLPAAEWSSDGSSLSGWTVSGATVDSGIGNPSPSLKATGGKYAYLAPVASLVGRSIFVDVRIISGTNALCNIFFACDAAGAGQMLRLDARAGAISTILATTSWTAWGGGDPGPTVASDTWLHVRIDVKSGDLADWYLNDAPIATDVGISTNGAYIAISGDFTNVTGGNFDNLAIYDTASISIRLNDSVRFELESVRDSLTSRHYHDITVVRDPPPSGA